MLRLGGAARLLAGRPVAGARPLQGAKLGPWTDTAGTTPQRLYAWGMFARLSPHSPHQATTGCAQPPTGARTRTSKCPRQAADQGASHPRNPAAALACAQGLQATR
jgi:hypothetical protein